jgi:hypothetical protein
MKADKYYTKLAKALSGRIVTMVNPASSIHRGFLIFLGILFLTTGPVQAFTANSLDITVDKNGDATAIFRFSLEGFIENAIPQSMLEEQLLKGMSTSSNPPELISMDRSSATIRMKNFADTSEVPTGTEYRTASMDFKKGEIALQNSGLSSVITADFSPASVVVRFPDNYSREFANSDTLPSISHTIIDPTKHPESSNTTGSGVPLKPVNGAVRVVSSPAGVDVSLDGQYLGTAPSTFTGISAGPHTFRFSRENYAPVSRTVTVNPGQTIQLSVFLSYVEPTPVQQSPGFAAMLAIGVLGLCIVMVRRK